MVTTLQAYGDTYRSVQFTDDAALTFFETIEDVYSYHVRHFTTWARERGAGVNIETVREYFTDLNASDYSANTKRIKRQGIKRRIRQMMENAPIDDRVRLDQLLKDLDRSGSANAPKTNGPAITQKKCLSPTEVDRLLSGARSRKQYLYIKFLYSTGLRIAEAIGIKKGHADREGDRVRIRVLGKGNKEREIVIPAALWDQIRDEWRGELYLFETSGGKPYSKCYISDQIAKLGRAVLDRRISAHTLRHSFITNQLKRGAPIEAVSRYVGHSSVAITMSMYAHREFDEADLLAFIDELN